MSRSGYLPLFLLFTLSTATLPAVQIVDWGGNYVSESQDFSNLSGTQMGGFTGGDPLLLSPSSGYSGPTFYGVVDWVTTGSGGDYGAIINASPDRLEIKRDNSDITGLVLFKQADFEGGLNTGNVVLDASSTMTTSFVTFVEFNPGRAVLRLQGGSQDGYYISQEAPFLGGTGQTNVTPLTTLTWLAYDPASDLHAFGAVVDILSDGVIENVTEVGFYARSTGTGANAYRISAFEVTAIPEPTSLLTVAIAGLGFLGLRRRKRWI